MTNYMNEGFKIINNMGDEEIIQIPYNINNILINEEDVIKILNCYNVKVDKIIDIEKFREAFTHKSYCKKNIYPEQILLNAKIELGNPIDLLELREKSYERMEFFGDRVLKLIVSMYLFYRYPNENEGFMTRLQTKIEDKTNLAIMSKEIGLSKFFIISKHIEMMHGRTTERMHEDMFEAFLGALFLSNGFESCCLLITNLLEVLIDYSEKLYCDNNYKDILLRHHHSCDWSHPKYDIIHFDGPAHRRKYIVGIQKHNALETDDKKDKYIGFGIGNTHKEGAQQSAKMALIIYGVLKEDQYSQSDIYYPVWDKIDNIDNNIDNDDNKDNNKEDKDNNDKDNNDKEDNDDNDDNKSICSNKSI